MERGWKSVILFTHRCVACIAWNFEREKGRYCSKYRWLYMSLFSQGIFARFFRIGFLDVWVMPHPRIPKVIIWCKRIKIWNQLLPLRNLASYEQLMVEG
jgi:hypothetical protein